MVPCPDPNCQGTRYPLTGLRPQYVNALHPVRQLLAALASVSSSEGRQEGIKGMAVVFAVEVKAMQGIVSSSPDLAACSVGNYYLMLVQPSQLGLMFRLSCCTVLDFCACRFCWVGSTGHLVLCRGCQGSVPSCVAGIPAQTSQ